MGQSGRLNQTIAQFELDLTLTEKGEEQYLKVIESVYAFINKIKAEGPQEYVYQELKSKDEIDFQNVAKCEAVRYANMLGKRMNFMAQSDDANLLLKMPYQLDGMDADEIKKMLDLLTPENMFGVFFSQTVKKDLEKTPEKFIKEYYY